VEADLVWLALVGVVTSVVSGYFYLRLVYLAFMYDGEGEVVAPPALNLVVGLAVVATLALGLLPGPWLAAAREAAFHGALMIAGG
jgi:NADH-quinone oxidoreductase subunit N